MFFIEGVSRAKVIMVVFFAFFWTLKGSNVSSPGLSVFAKPGVSGKKN